MDSFICKYCGKECKNKNSLSQHEIRCKENPNKIPCSFDKINLLRKQGIISGENQYTKAKRLGLEKPIMSEVTRKSIGNIWKGKHLPEEMKNKISKSCSKFYEEHPDKCSWVLSHSSKISYPEQYFKDLFEKEQINLKYHKQIGKYQLDFFNDEYKICVEIDGEQHYNSEKSIKRDKNRTLYLESLGWKVIRIRWSSYKTKTFEEKQEIINSIKQEMIS